MPPPIDQGPRGKPVTRRTMLLRRDGLTSDERATASLVIARRAAAEAGAARTVALYAPKGSEVDTAALDAALRARGITVVYPRVLDDRRELVFFAARLDELVASRFGLREPAPGAAIALDSIDVFFVPGVAFDRAGGRIGWGRGHYDATLAEAPRALRVGIAFECQVVDRVESDPHDIPLHRVVTEVATYRTRD